MVTTFKGATGLKPGMYLAHNGQIKAFDAYAAEMMFGNVKNPSAETLAGSVAWMWAAIQERRDTLRELQVEWERNGTPQELGALDYDPLLELPRLDAAVTLYGAAYLFKLRNAGGRLVGLRFLDPATMTPDDNGRDRDTGELTHYWRTVGSQRTRVPVEDVIRVYDPGLREDAPWLWSAKSAALPAQIARSIGQTFDWFFETNGLPVLMINVPPAMMPDQRDDLRDKLTRVFNRRAASTNKSIAVSGEVTITPISLAPKDLDTLPIVDQQREAILAAFGVPAALVYKDVNMAEAREKRAMFVGRMSGVVELYSAIISADEDVARLGLRLVPHAERHESIQRQELEKAEALQRSVMGPVMSQNEARERLELEPWPGEEFNRPVMQTGGRAIPEPRIDAGGGVPDVKATEMAKLRRFIADGKYKRRAFSSDLLTAAEVAAEIERYEMQTGYTEAVKQFTEAMRSGD